MNIPSISICQQCGEEIIHKPSKSPKFCSRKCKADSQQGKQEYKIKLDMDEIKRLYLEEKLSAATIGRKMGVNKKLILERLHDMKVKMRTTGQGRGLDMLRNGNPNDMPGVKEKQRQAQIKFNKENPEIMNERNNAVRKTWQKQDLRDTKSKQMVEVCSGYSDEKKQQMMIKQFNTKRKNGTFNCTGIENKYAAILDEQGIEHVREYIIPEGTKRYRYDFYIPSEHLLVEVNGTGTHADPEKYLAEDVVKLGIPGWKVRTAKEIWHQDEVKKLYAVRKGYGIKTVWEREL